MNRLFIPPQSLFSMSDILSQSEVDSLFAALDRPGGPTPARRIDAAEFSVGPSEVGAAHMVRGVQEKLADEFARTLRDRLAADVTVTPGGIDRLTWGESVTTIDELSCLAVLSDGASQPFLVELESSIALPLVDRLLGGQGSGPAAPPRRALTEIERRLLSRIADLAGAALAVAWRDIREIRPRVAQIERDPRRLRFVPVEASIVQMGFEVAVEAAFGLVTLRFPATEVEGSRSPAVARDDDRSQAPVRNENAPCLVVRLASTRLAAQDVANLEVGDMIVTDCDPARPVTVFLEGTARFSGFAGLVKDRKAVRLGAAVGERPASEMPGSGPGETAAAD